jgi:uncharacterized protein YeaO (DUF488 family)
VPLKTKRWNDPREGGDGYRLLICRYRPRALPRAKETWDGWCKELSPSRELHADYYGKNGPPISWEEFRPRFLQEMRAQTALLDELAAMVGEGKTITLLCSSACEDATRCHRTLVKHLIEERMK